MGAIGAPFAKTFCGKNILADSLTAPVIDGEPEKFAIKKRVDKVSTPSPGFHLAFHAGTKDEVHSFYREALKFGGKDNGAPGPRPEYGSRYYAAFVIDPDGYEVEVKLHVQ